MSGECNERKGDIEKFGNIMNFNLTGESAIREASALFEMKTGDLSGSSRVGSGRVRSLYTAGLLVKSAKFAGVYGSVLGSRWSSSRPAVSGSKMALDLENVFGVDFANLVPVKNRGGERISDYQREIGKGERRSLDTKVDRGGKQKSKSGESEVLYAGVLGLDNRGQEHSKAEEIAKTAVKA